MSGTALRYPTDMIDFHDASVSRVAISIVRQEVEVDLGLRTSSGRDRDLRRLAFSGVTLFGGSFDFAELSDHARPGNVQAGDLDSSSGKLHLSTVGGFVNANFGGVELRARADVESTSYCAPDLISADGIQGFENSSLDFSYIESIEFSPKFSSCCVEMQARTGISTSDRAPASLVFQGVTASFCRLNVVAMSGVHKYGNVGGCTIYPERNMLRMYLADGFLEISAHAASLVRR